MEKLKPIGPHVFLEPIYERESSGGVLYGHEARYPTSGFIWSVGRGCSEALQEADFAVFEEHGFTQSDLRHDTFFIRLRDGNGVHIVRADIDIEPVVREYLESYRRTKEDRKISTKDIDRDGEGVSFLTSDIEDISLGLYSETGYTLSYRHHLFLSRYLTNLDHDLMIVPEREILFTIAYEDLEDGENNQT